jgi:hypothetical protein
MQIGARAFSAGVACARCPSPAHDVGVKRHPKAPKSGARNRAGPLQAHPRPIRGVPLSVAGVPGPIRGAFSKLAEKSGPVRAIFAEPASRLGPIRRVSTVPAVLLESRPQVRARARHHRVRDQRRASSGRTVGPGAERSTRDDRAIRPPRRHDFERDGSRDAASPSPGRSQVMMGTKNVLVEPWCQAKTAARPVRFERTTLGFEVRCSIQLSYGRRCCFRRPRLDDLGPAVQPRPPRRLRGGRTPEGPGSVRSQAPRALRARRWLPADRTGPGPSRARNRRQADCVCSLAARPAKPAPRSGPPRASATRLAAVGNHLQPA